MRKNPLFLGCGLAALAAGTAGSTPAPNPGITQDCIECVEQLCCTASICPECSSNCEGFTMDIPYTVLVPVPGPWEPAEADDQVCFVQLPCETTAAECSATTWVCVPDPSSAVYHWIDGCYEGTWCMDDPTVAY